MNFRQNSVTSDVNMRVMRVTIDSRIRAVYRGFVQSSVDVYRGMNGYGFNVACGALGESGDPMMGHRYLVAIRHRTAPDRPRRIPGPSPVRGSGWCYSRWSWH